MKHFVDGLHALAMTLRNGFRKPTTVEFPDVIRPRAERYRTTFSLLYDEQGDQLCIGCLQCERICPSEVIAIKAAGKKESPVTGKKRGYADDFVLDLAACIYCELCVQVCPVDAIVMTREPETPTFSREDLVLTMERLYANGKNRQRAWSDGTKLMAMQEAGRAAPPPKAAHHAKAAEPAKTAAVEKAPAAEKAPEAAKANEPAKAPEPPAAPATTAPTGTEAKP
ncbi:MAG: NADH-quinone oxidoreductase subunit I [Planctomycetes bacterium]|nr:NADH-quinone oxidoreductase subunit I [Planctomycetota bacterium]